MSFVTQEDVFAAVEPVLQGVFEEFGGGKPVTPKHASGFPTPRPCGNTAPTSRTYAIRSSCRMCPSISAVAVSRSSRGLLEIENNEVWAIPAPGGGQRTFADRMNSWAQGEGQPGLGYMLFFDRAKDETMLAADPKATGVGARGPLANNIGPERSEAIRAALGLKAGDAAFFVAGDPSKFAKFAGLARTEGRAGAQVRRRKPVRVLLGRRLSNVRVERGRKEDRLLAQSLLHAAGRPRGAEKQGPARDQGLSVRHRLQRLRTRLGRDSQPRPGRDGKAFEIAGYGRRAVEERFGGMYRAFHYGAPPHGGIAPGIDRIVMLLAANRICAKWCCFR